MKEARRLAKIARGTARGRGAKAKLRAAAKLEEIADSCEKVAGQIRKRVKGEPIKDRIVSLFDPDARPIRKGKLGNRTSSGRVAVGGGDRAHPGGARGLILPAAATEIGNPGEDTLLPTTIAEMKRLGSGCRRSPWMAGSTSTDQQRARGPSAEERVHRWPPGTWLQAHRPSDAALPNGAEGRISHLKRRYGLTDPASKATRAGRSGLNGASCLQPRHAHRPER